MINWGRMCASDPGMEQTRASSPRRCWPGLTALLLASLALTDFFLLRGQQLEHLAATESLEAQDLAVLDRQKPLSGLECRVDLNDPDLGFDFRFTGVLRVTIPFELLSTRDGALTLAARLKSREPGKPPALFSQVATTSTPENASKTSRIQVTLFFALGEGSFQLDWMIRNQAGQGCSKRHRFKTRLKGSERGVRMRIAPEHAVFYRGETFGFEKLEPDATQGPPLHLRVLLNFPPFKDPDRRLYAFDIFRIVSILREIARHPRVGKLDLLAFNLKDQRTLYVQRDSDFVDYPALYHAIRQLDGNQIRAEALRTGADMEFLVRVLKAEFKNAKSLDAVVLIGPRLEMRRELERRLLSEIVPEAPPTFYLRYRFGEAGGGWGDAVTPFVDWVDGKTYSVYRPVDLWRSVERMIGEIER